MRRINKVIALNDGLKNRFVRKYGVLSENILVVPNGVDQDIFKPRSDVDHIKQKYNIKDKTIVLCVGRMTESKGIEYLVKAADLLVNRDKCNGIIFLLVGPHGEFGSSTVNQYFFKILRLITKNKLENYVKLTGSVPYEDLKMIYAACDIFVLPSLYEGFAMSTMEAMASGKPVICTNIPGLRTQVKDDWNGYLVEPADENGIVDSVKLLICDKEKIKKMGQNSRDFIEKNLTWEKVSEKLLDIYIHKDIRQ